MKNENFEMLVQNCCTAFSELVRALHDAAQSEQRPASASYPSPVATDGLTEQVVRQVARRVKKKVEWFAVYKALVVAELWPDRDYTAFARMLKKLQPSHPYLPEGYEIGRKDCGIFRKHPAKWKPEAGIWSGKHFEDARRLALDTLEAIRLLS